MDSSFHRHNEDRFIDAAGIAALPAKQYETFVGNPGMTLTEAATLGSLDNLMLRYVNPDIDNNGFLDTDEKDSNRFRGRHR